MFSNHNYRCTKFSAKKSDLKFNSSSVRLTTNFVIVFISLLLIIFFYFYFFLNILLKHIILLLNICAMCGRIYAQRVIKILLNMIC